MAKYINPNYDQHTMVVINFKEHLQPGTLEYTLQELFDHHIDLSFFDEVYRNDDCGRPAIHPAILLKIILFAYSKGVTSSREIEWCCSNNVTFMALSCHTVPHWTTIANFVSSFNDQITQLFERVLLICDQQNLLGHDLIAIDGCKMPSNAAKEWSGTLDELKAKHGKIKKRVKHALELHRKLDAMGRTDLAERHQQAAQTMQTAVDRIAEFLTTAEPRMGRGRRPKEVKSNITDNESAKMKTSKGTIQGYNGVAAVDKKHQVIVDATAFGEGQEHHSLQPVLEQISDRYQSLGINDDVFDTDIIVTADTGFANEANMKYLKENNINGYIPDNKFRSRDPKFEGQKIKYPKSKRSGKQAALIPSSEFIYDPVTRTCICPVGEAMWLLGERENADGVSMIYFEGRLTKCRICSIKDRCMRNPESADTRKGHGRQVSFTVNNKRAPTCTDWMKHRVDSETGKKIYSHRMSVVEPVFGNIGYNKGLNRFTLRSKKKVNTQWQLFCLVHNIEKIHNYGQIAV